MLAADQPPTQLLFDSLSVCRGRKKRVFGRKQHLGKGELKTKNMTDVFEPLNKHLQIKEQTAKVGNSSGNGKLGWQGEPAPRAGGAPGETLLLTDFVFSFDGKLQNHLLGISADKDKWRPRFLAQVGIL